MLEAAVLSWDPSLLAPGLALGSSSTPETFKVLVVDTII